MPDPKKKETLAPANVEPSDNGEKYWILPDGEYRIWVRNNISAGLTARVLGFLGVTTLAGFGGLYYGLSQVAEDVITDKLKTETVLMKNDVIDTIQKDLTPAIQSGIVNTLVEKTELVKAATSTLQKKAEEEVSNYLGTEDGRSALLTSISENSVVESAILRRALTVVENSQDPNERAQALPLVLLFRPDQTENKKLLVAILKEGVAELAGQPLEDSALTDRALQDYPFTDVEVPGAKDTQLDAEAIDAALIRLQKLSDAQATRLPDAYGRFLSDVPLRYLSKLRAWLVTHADTSLGNLVALALLERKDHEGIPQIASLLKEGFPIAAQAMAVRALSKVSPIDQIAAQPRREALLALWFVRTNAGLAEELRKPGAGAVSVGAGSDFTMPLDDIYYSFLTLSPVLDEALLRLLRADDESSDWSAFFVPNLLEPLEDYDDVLADIFSLWQRRLIFEQQRGLKIENAAGQTLETLTDLDRVGMLFEQDMAFVQWLVSNISAEYLQRFIEGYPALFETTQTSRSLKPGLLATAIKRDAALNPARPRTWALLDGQADWSNNFLAHMWESLIISANLSLGSTSDPEALFAAAGDRLAASRTGADSDLAAMLATAAQFRADKRSARAAVFKSGILTALAGQSNPSERLRAVSEELSSAYPVPDCPDGPASNFEKPAEERYTLSIESGQLRRVILPEGRQLTALVSPESQSQQFDFFIWDADCTRATWHLNEATGMLQIGDSSAEEIVLQVISEGRASSEGKVSSEGKPPNAMLTIYPGPEWLTSSETQPITLGRTYQVTPVLEGEATRTFNVSMDLKTTETLWLATGDLIGSADTTIELFQGDDPNAKDFNDDFGGGIASALRFTASEDATYKALVANFYRSFGIDQGFTLRTFKSSEAPLQANADMKSAPPLPPDDFTEVTVDSSGAANYVKITPTASGYYRVETLAPLGAALVLRNTSEGEVPSVGTPADNGDIFRLDGGQNYFLQVPAGINDRSVLRVRMTSSPVIGMTGALIGAAAGSAAGAIIGHVTDRAGYCYARDAEGQTVVIACPPGL